MNLVKKSKWPLMSTKPWNRLLVAVFHEVVHKNQFDAAWRKTAQLVGRPEKQFELLELIGRGGFGEVHKARVKNNYKNLGGKFVAVKVTTKGSAASIETKTLKIVLENGDASLRKFVIMFYDGFTVKRITTSLSWQVLEYCEAGDLYHAMKYIKRSLEQSELVMILAQIALAISCIHDLEIIHRDIKALNVLLMRSGIVKLADFGCSSIIGDKNGKKVSRKHRFGKNLVSDFWMAPELFQSKRSHTKSSDIWSFGITAIELSHGQNPFASVNSQMAWGVISSLPSLDRKSQLASLRLNMEKPTDLFAAKLLIVPALSRPTIQDVVGDEFIKGECDYGSSCKKPVFPDLEKLAVEVINKRETTDYDSACE